MENTGRASLGSMREQLELERQQLELEREQLALQRGGLSRSLQASSCIPRRSDGVLERMAPNQRLAPQENLRMAPHLERLEAPGQHTPSLMNLKPAPEAHYNPSLLKGSPLPGASAAAGQEARAISRDTSSTGSSETNSQRSPPEFLIQLVKMMEKVNNKDIIEWTDGSIRIHDPQRLEKELLHKYFRHSNLTSFQRQLNYFGFHKASGFGKYSPCSYTNDVTTSHIRSLFNIKRKKLSSSTQASTQLRREAMERAMDANTANAIANNMVNHPTMSATAALSAGPTLPGRAPVYPPEMISSDELMRRLSHSGIIPPNELMSNQLGLDHYLLARQQQEQQERERSRLQALVSPLGQQVLSDLRRASFPGTVPSIDQQQPHNLNNLHLLMMQQQQQQASAAAGRFEPQPTSTPDLLRATLPGLLSSNEHMTNNQNIVTMGNNLELQRLLREQQQQQQERQLGLPPTTFATLASSPNQDLSRHLAQLQRERQETLNALVTERQRRSSQPRAGLY